MEAQDHIAPELLLYYLENRVDEETAGRVRAHLDTGCAPCSRELASWSRSLAVLADAEASAPPEEVVERAFRVFDRMSDSRAMPRPSWWEPIPIGMEPARAGAPDSFQLLFEAAGTDIDLLCECAEGDWSITGQALSASA